MSHYLLVAVVSVCILQVVSETSGSSSKRNPSSGKVVPSGSGFRVPTSLMAALNKVVKELQDSDPENSTSQKTEAEVLYFRAQVDKWMKILNNPRNNPKFLLDPSYQTASDIIRNMHNRNQQKNGRRSTDK